MQRGALFTYLFAGILFSTFFPLSKATAQSFFIGENNVAGGSLSDHAFSVVATPDGGYLMAGHSDGEFNGFVSKGGYDAIVSKYNASGNHQWTRNYGGSQYDFSEKIIATQDGNFAVVGFTQSSNGDIPDNNGAMDIWVFKIDPAGQLLWSYTYGGPGNEGPNELLETPTGELIIVGQTRSGKGDFSDIGGNYGNFDGWLLKLNANGLLLWEQNYGGTEEDYIMDVLVSANGYVCFGSTPSHDFDLTSNHGDWDYWLFEIDTAGQSLWLQHYGGSGPEYSNSMVATATGYFLAGSTFSDDVDISLNRGGADWWLVSTDFSGNLISEVSYGGSANESVSDLQLNGAGTHHYIVGHTYSADGDILTNRGNFDLWMLAIDGNGNVNANATFGSSDNDIAQALGCGLHGKDWVLAESKVQAGDVPEAFGEIDQWWFAVNLAPTALLEAKDKPDWQLFPNPVQSEQTLSIKGLDPSVTTVYLVDLLGRRQPLSRSITGDFSLPETAPGSYWIEVNESSHHAVLPLQIAP
ncbi:MAG: hypothetical protein ACFB10_19155 [Salibacteraceae bacterium]